jgi:hypothetical protein
MVTHLLNHEVVFAQGNKHGVTCLSPCASLILSELFTSVIYLIFSSKWSLYHRPLPNLHTGPTDHQHGCQAHAIKVAIAIFREPIFKIDPRIDLAKPYVDPTTTPARVHHHVSAADTPLCHTTETRHFLRGRYHAIFMPEVPLIIVYVASFSLH